MNSPKCSFSPGRCTPLASVLFLALTLMSALPAAFAQGATLSASTVSFGTRVIGVARSAISVTLSNPDPAHQLLISRIAASGDYSVTNNCGGVVVAAGSCVLNVNFSPTATEETTGVISLFDDANNSPQLIATSGTGVQVLTSTPASLTFGTVAAGKTSAGKTVTVTNNSSKSVSLTFAASGEYIVFGSGSGSCVTGTLATHASCTLSVAFTPTTNGTVKGSLSVSQNLSTIPLLVNLSGTGSGATTASLTFSPASLTFGNLLLQSTSANRSVTVTNQSTKAVNISSSIASRDFKVTGGTCGGALQPSSQCSIFVDFTPTALGSITGGLTVSDNGSIKTQVVNLSGTAIEALSASPTSLTFGATKQGKTSGVQTVTLKNNLAEAVALNFTASGDFGTRSTAANACASTLAAEAQCSMGVFFNPAGISGTVSGELTVRATPSADPLVVPLTARVNGTEVPRFAYAVTPGNGDNTITAYAVNFKTGQLTPNGYFLAGGYPFTTVVHPSQNFLYAPNFFDNNISAFTINPTNGSLTPIPGSPFAAGKEPITMAITPSGSFAYVPDFVDNTILAYSISSGTGAMTPVSGSPFPTGSGPTGLSVTSKFVYVTNQTANTVSGYTITAGGALQGVPNSPFPTVSEPVVIVTDPSGKFVYVLGSGDTVSGYAIQANGSLIAVAGSPFATGHIPSVLTTDQAGKFLFVPDLSGEISVFNINPSTGSLTSVAGSPFLAPGAQFTAVTVDPSNQFLYATDQVNDVALTYSLNPATGALAQKSAVATRDQAFSVSVVSGTAPVTYTPEFAYTVNQTVDDTKGQSISEFTINPFTGALTEVSGSPLTIGRFASRLRAYPYGGVAFLENDVPPYLYSYDINPITGALSQANFLRSDPPPTTVFALDPSGRFLPGFVSVYPNPILSSFSIDQFGDISFLSSVAYEGTIAEAMTADPLGRYFYVVDHAAEMYVYRMAPSTGALTEIEGSPYAIGSTFATPVVDPCGRFVYVPNYGQTSSTISGFAILPNGGTLAPIAGSPFAGGEAAIALAIDPTGRFLYSANFGFVAVYTINSSTGALTFIANVSSGQNNNADIAVDPSGRFLYLVANNDVFAYSINSTTGLLTAVPGSPFATDILPEFLTLVDHIH